MHPKIKNQISDTILGLFFPLEDCPSGKRHSNEKPKDPLEAAGGGVKESWEKSGPLLRRKCGSHFVPRSRSHQLFCVGGCRSMKVFQEEVLSQLSFCFYFLIFIWLHWVLVAACRIFSCGMRTLSFGMWDLVPWPGTEPGLPALGVRSLSHWTIREVPSAEFFFLSWILMEKYEKLVQGMEGNEKYSQQG